MDDLQNNETQLDIYKSLLLKRDALKKESKHWQFTYLREFGELLEKRYSLIVECIKYKKIIAYCQSKANKGLEIYKAELETYVDNVMDNYYIELRSLGEICKSNPESLPEIEVYKIKKLYRKLAVMLHPDLHPALYDDFEAYELWDKIRCAYECNDYKSLKEAEILAAALLEKREGKKQQIEIEDIDKKIAALRDEIGKIINNDPYRYKFLLADDEAVQSTKDELNRDIEDYGNYLKELKSEAETFKIREDA